VDIRIISATHRNLDAMVVAGKFRQDLLFRLQVITINVPPLRERREDIRLLAQDFLARQARINAETLKPLSCPALAALESYSWPGNVRELFNALEQANVMAEGDGITPEDLPLPIRAPINRAAGSELNLDEAIRRKITEALTRARNRRTYAAALLGIERRKLNRYITKFGIPVSRHDIRD
jgi:DNA-binding NtrC family response regulator